MNRLSQETSPYLKQHAQNPVDWFVWGDAAFEKARAENKPVLLSIGYAACHWCHVMAHESFEDAETAALMNHYFINIKVDREERPDIDHIYQNALSLMGQQGGWPLTMFLTPDGKPFWGGTYFPPLARHGLPAFREVLRGVHESFLQEQDKITHNVAALHRALLSLQENQQGKTLDPTLRKKGAEQFLKRVDMAHGGLGTAPKFPHLPALRFLWDTFIATADDRYKHAVLHSLTQMCQGGIYDHIGGGFARYAVDDEWLVPHFEKMLADNALFISLLSDVFLETKNPIFESRVHETIQWALREMTIEKKDAFALSSSLDADSGGVEGAFYTWRLEEITAVLNPDDLSFFAPIYDASKFGNWEGVNILNRLQHPLLQSVDEEKRLKKCCDLLLAKRNERVRPGRDDKVLADANALFIVGLVKAGTAFKNQSYIQHAEKIFSFVEKNMFDGNKHLRHSFCEGTLTQEGFLDDYVHLADAALYLFSATQNNAYLVMAEKLAQQAITLFYDEQRGGFFSNDSRDAFLPVRPKTIYDAAQPSANAALVRILSQLYNLTGKKIFFEKADDTLRAFSGEALQNFFPLASLFSASAVFERGLNVVLTGENTHDLVTAFSSLYLPYSTLMIIKETKSLPLNHPAYSKTALSEKGATAFVCSGTRCLAPVHTAQDLAAALISARRFYGADASNDG